MCEIDFTLFDEYLNCTIILAVFELYLVQVQKSTKVPVLFGLVQVQVQNKTFFGPGTSTSTEQNFFWVQYKKEQVQYKVPI